MYRTASNLEDLNFVDELGTYNSVGLAMDRCGFGAVEPQYRDVDLYIMMMNDSEEQEIRDLLSICGMTAWLEYDDKMVKIGE